MCREEHSTFCGHALEQYHKLLCGQERTRFDTAFHSAFRANHRDVGGVGGAQIQGTCTVIAFNMEVTKLGHGDGLTESGIDRVKALERTCFFYMQKTNTIQENGHYI